MYMGGSGTFVDGVLRWFHRRHTNEDAILTQPHNSADTLLQGKEEDKQEFTITEDFDITGLKLIKVPKRFHLPISSSSMDPLKKVSLFSFSYLRPPPPFFFPLDLTF